ncbi:hypothetical protein [Streptomyces sp. NPDC020681]|uniref:hypothetical protein n=1 Tax=Streptomyces sp. NPDC020681 TaxID=3365083 RepID=UPI00379F2D39
MAEDIGTGASAAFGAFSMVPFVGGIAAAAKLVTELESMTTFKKEVDKMLVDLEGSEAAPDKVTAERLEPANLGTADFKESAFLYGAYTVVHDELEKLSKILALQVDGLSIAVQASQVGYENIDYDIRQRMRNLASEVDAHYGDQAQQSGANHQAGGGAAQPGDTHGAA